MPQNSTNSNLSLNIANGYKTTPAFQLGGIVGQLTGGNSTAGQQISMSQLKYTFAKSQQARVPAPVLYGSWGYYVAVSADGNTAIISAKYGTTGGSGAIVYTRSGSTWTLQQNLGTNAPDGVSISADGNYVTTAHLNNKNVRMYVRSGSTWSLQQSITGAENYFGNSATISSDATTLAIGSPLLAGNIGGAYIYTRSGSTWTQQGSTLTGTGNTGNSFQGTSVALSADGNTLALASFYDDSSVGATWIFTRSGTTWTQQGSKLVGTGNSGASRQGYSVALSADGSTLASGAYSDNGDSGSTWIFTRSGTTWTQQGSKLVGTGGSGTPQQGYSVSLSADGNVLSIGAPADNNYIGAVWVFTRTNTTWTQQGAKITPTGSAPSGGINAFGMGVSFSKTGNTLIVGSVYESADGSGSDYSGAFYSFT